ncbi:MAG: hypothetical protein LQ349_000094 [Xanthoria aureola]|nr:MAG: hypothetical protein LQ349_000094 [Xanthoria aureola]
MSPSHLEALTQVTRHFAKLGEYNLDSGARLHSSRKRRRSRSSQRIPSPEQGSGSGAGKPYQPTVKDVSDKDDIDQRPIKKIREDLTPTVNGKTTSPSISNSTSPSTSNSTSPSKSKQAARKQKATKKPTRKDGSGTRKVPARSKASITKCSVWKPILRLENIELDRAAKQYLTEHGINAAPLFADCRPLENEVLGFNGGETSGDVFAAHFKYTVTLEDRRSVDTIRLFFQLLICMTYKFTSSGDPHDEAFDHLRSLGLAAAAKESGADELARNIRQLLITPFESQGEEGSDEENSSADGSGEEDSVAAEATDEQDRDAEGSDAEGSDAEGSDAEGSDVEDEHAEETGGRV